MGASAQELIWVDVDLPNDYVSRVRKQSAGSFAIGLFTLYVMIWGMPVPDPVVDLADRLTASDYAIRLLALVATVTVGHEVLHALAMVLFGRHRLDRIGWVWQRHDGWFALHFKREVPLWAYRVSLLLPALLLGLAGIVIGLTTENLWLLTGGFVALMLSTGDILMVFELRKISPGRLVYDQPARTGCRVLVIEQDGKRY